MKLNINDPAKLQDLMVLLAERNVSSTAITTIEKALRTGMSFKQPEDLTILNIPTVDLNVVGELVEFGVKTVVVKNIKTTEYRFTPVGDESFFFGYQFIVTFVNRAGFSIEEAYPIEDLDTVIVDYDLNDLKTNSIVTLRVNTAQGKHARLRLSSSDIDLNEDLIEIPIPQLRNETIEVEVDELELPGNPSVTATYPIKGKLISNRSDAKMDGYQIVIFAATTIPVNGNTPGFLPVAFAKTETNGFFVTSPLLFEHEADISRVTAAKALVTRDEFSVELAIRLVISSIEDDGAPVTSMLPERLILVIDESLDSLEEDESCKDCGCTDLNFHEKKVLEEYSYYSVVRTSEPSIIADVLEEEEEIDLQDIYGVPGIVPLRVFKKFQAIESKQIKSSNFFQSPTLILGPQPAPDNGVTSSTSLPATRTSTSLVAAAVKGPTFNRDLMNRLVIEDRVNIVIRGNAKPVFKGRAHLSPLNQIDWDDEPTIYQAASIAHGHLLHFKQEWQADGYSIGDLAYSLPLAPGQKKQIAVLDWERRESAANSQALDYEETLNNSLVRDRDINEVVSGTLTENVRGNSKASTGGIGFGFGAAAMGLLPGGGSFGALLGISGGTSSSGSSAGQNSSRESTANSLQSISDRTQQAASVVRSQRSTVVQTVSQGERVEATSESVANYNHCHAITIQYFEVLRHFAVRHRLAGVQECLFVPLQIGPFDLDKCLRWRSSLERHLFKRQLRPAFEAVARIQNEKESASENYYDSIGFPRKNFAEQAIGFYTGELFMQFFFFNTKEEKIDQDIINFYKFFGISLDDFRDRQITDEELADHVGPRAIEYLLDAFTIETDKGIDLKLDLSLISTFRQNSLLRISVRQSAGTRVDVRRDQIEGINIKLDLDKIADVQEKESLERFQNKYMKIRLRSANLRYRTDNSAGTLLSGRIDNDIFAGDDGAFIVTSLTREELRNPRGEDVNAANSLIQHLNENLEYYHKCLFFDMTPERRFMLLDGIIAPGKALGRSVASVVENRVIGIAGNSLIMPVAPGYQLDPTIDETFDLFAQYFHEDPEPMRISMPTKGIFAEAVMGKCNSCEEKDESKFWRWEESPIPDSPTTQILPLNTDTRRADPGNLQPKDFPAPVVNIQNAPNVPDPTGLQSLIQLLGKGDSFRDLTGLNQNQLNALATFQKSLDTAQAFGKEAAELAKAAGAMKMVEDAKKSGTISNEQAKEKGGAILDKIQSDPNANKLRQSIATIDALEKEGKISSGDSATVKNSLLKNFLDSSNAQTPMSNAEIQNLADAVNKNNADITVERPGEKVDIKKQLDGRIGGNTSSQTLNIPNLAHHQGYNGMFKLSLTRDPDGSFKVGMTNDSFDFIDVGPIHATNESNITLKPESSQFGDLVPLNPKSTVVLYEGSLKSGAGPLDFVPTILGIQINLGIKTEGIRSNLSFAFPFKRGLRIPCVEGRNIGTHTGLKKFAVDLGVPRGTEVLAAIGGTVVDVVSVEPNVPIGQPGAEGTENIVRIRHTDLTYGVYGHLNTNSITVKVGQEVAKGTLLGLSGNSGPSSGDHLHFAVEKATTAGFETVDWDFFDKLNRAFVPIINSIFEAENGLVGGKLLFGTGEPEDAVAGDIGDIFAQQDGTPGNLYFEKQSGASGSTTGWKVRSTLP